MNLSLTRKEFEALLFMGATAQRVLCMDTSLDDRSEFQQQIDHALKTLEHKAAEIGLGEYLIEADEGPHLNYEYYVNVLDKLDTYQIYSFYEKGAELLGGRDVTEQYTEVEFNKFTNEEQHEMYLNACEQYHKEWEEHDYDRLRIVKK